MGNKASSPPSEDIGEHSPLLQVKSICPNNVDPTPTLFDPNTATKKEIIAHLHYIIDSARDRYPNDQWILSLIIILSNPNVFRAFASETRFRRVTLERMAAFSRRKSFYEEHKDLLARVTEMYSETVEDQRFQEDTAKITELLQSASDIIGRYHLAPDQQNALMKIVKDAVGVSDKQNNCILCS